jgi:hypothetical protein
MVVVDTYELDEVLASEDIDDGLVLAGDCCQGVVNMIVVTVGELGQPLIGWRLDRRDGRGSATRGLKSRARRSAQHPTGGHRGLFCLLRIASTMVPSSGRRYFLCFIRNEVAGRAGRRATDDHRAPELQRPSLVFERFDVWCSMSTPQRQERTPTSRSVQ